MKKVVLTLILAVFAFGDSLKVSDFVVDIYSKSQANSTKKIRLNLELLGRDLEQNEAYVLDALNVIVGSFYVEDLLTSLGKEKFKEAFIKYASKKHGIDMEEVLILGLKVVEKPEIEEIINAIRAKNLCGSSSVSSGDDMSDRHQNSGTNRQRGNNIIVTPELKNINQRPIDLNTINEFGKDFGE